jgi:hypothetical protein
MSADDFFNEGAPSAIATIKALGDRPGTTIGGPIVEIGEQVQQKDVNTGAPAVWPDGNPKMMLPVTVATELRDPSINDDDGHRTFWVSGNLKKTIGSALRQAGAKLAVGGVLQVTFTGYGEAKKGFNPPREWTATYVPPAPGAGFFEAAQAAPAQPAPQPVAQPVAQPAAAAPQPTAEQIAAYQLAQQQAAAAQAAAAAQPAPQLDAQAAAYAAQMGFPTAPPA